MLKYLTKLKTQGWLDKHFLELPIRFKVGRVEISFAEKLEASAKCWKIYRKEGLGWSGLAVLLHCPLSVGLIWGALG